MKVIGRSLIAEYRAIFRDGGALLVLVGALALYAFFYPIPYTPQVLKEVPLVVVDLDRSDMSRRLARMADADELLRVTASAASMSEAERLVREGRAGGVLAIPADFEKRIRRGEQASVSVYADASYFLVYRQVLTGVVESAGTLSAGIEVRRLQAQGLPLESAMKARDPLPLISRPLFNPSEGYASYVVPAVLVLILQQTLLVGIGMVAGTRRERRAVAAASGSLPTLLGRTIAYFTIYLFHALFYFGVVFRLLGFPQRASALAILLFTTPFLLAVIFLGFSLAAIFPRRETSIQVLLFTSLPAIFLAGFSWPVEALPRWLAAAASLLPSTSAIAGFLRLTQMGAALGQVRAEYLTLWALTGGYFLVAWAVAEWSGRRSAQEARR